MHCFPIGAVSASTHQREPAERTPIFPRAPEPDCEGNFHPHQKSHCRPSQRLACHPDLVTGYRLDTAPMRSRYGQVGGEELRTCKILVPAIPFRTPHEPPHPTSD